MNALTRTSRILIPAALVFAVSLTGCSGGKDESASGAAVASLPVQGDKAQAAPSAANSVDPRRPRLRVDTTEEEKERLITVWGKCVKGKGAPVSEKEGGLVVPDLTQREAFLKVYQACADKEPVYPSALDPAQNPHYAEDERNWVTCINEKSPIIKVKLADDGPKEAESYDTVTDAVRDAFDETFQNCKYEAFGRG
jgi:hypothetical protein